MMRRKQAELRSRHVGRGTVRGVAEAIFDGDGKVRISGEILGKKNHHLDTQPQGKQLAQSPEEHLMQSQITRDASASINCFATQPYGGLRCWIGQPSRRSSALQGHKFSVPASLHPTCENDI